MGKHNARTDIATTDTETFAMLPVLVITDKESAKMIAESLDTAADTIYRSIMVSTSATFIRTESTRMRALTVLASAAWNEYRTMAS